MATQKHRQIVLDTETTGREVSSGHRIIEIGCLEVIDRQITQNSFHCYINPERDSEPGALAVHGLTSEFLKNKPLFLHIANDLLSFIEGAELIIHNAPFDLAFLDAEFKRLNKKHKSVNHYCRILDTLPLARRLHPGQRNSLDALCKRYQVDNSQRKLHGALLDAELLARVYLIMTGGQTSLFNGNSTREVHSTIKQTASEIKNITLPIIEASANELVAHKEYLNRIKNQIGYCVWDNINQENK